ncbi:hypothetical protein JW911_01830 [Candidatus Peregrinibacteria bacterium]|nr:hypothetical protein [Candidatus Peregrinibacteria bacterium]
MFKQTIKILVLLTFILNCITFSCTYVFAQGDTGSGSSTATPATSDASTTPSTPAGDEPAERITTPPPIPQISTLPGPQGTDVRDANLYLQQSFLPSITMTVIRIAIPLAVVFLIFGAVQFLTAYGSDEKLNIAKKTITWSLVGLVISLLSYAIVQLIFFSGYQITSLGQ